MTDATAKPGAARPLKGVHVGVVTGDRRDKTRTVAVERQVKHPKYGKYLKRSSRIHVHDAENRSHLGDRVEIVNCRPLSKTKSWRLVRVVTAAPRTETEPAT